MVGVLRGSMSRLLEEFLIIRVLLSDFIVIEAEEAARDLIVHAGHELVYGRVH